MAEVTIDVTGIARGKPRIPEPIADALIALLAGVNEIHNEQCAADMGLETSKLELASGSPTSPLLNNDVPYQAKTSGDAAKLLLALTADNHFVLGQLVRNGGSATNWNTAGSSAYVADKWTIQVGSRNVAGSTFDTITFDIPFAYNPIVLPILVTTDPTQNPVSVSAVTPTDCRLHNGHTSARDIYWIAFGPIT